MPSVIKRVKISKMQQHIMIATLVTSMIVGLTAVLTIHMAKYISFYGTVIGEKDDAIKGYYSAIKNVGICNDPNKDGEFSNAELEGCDPDAVDITKMPDSLRYKVMEKMANNLDLESVGARKELLGECYNGDKKIDFTIQYREAETDQDRDQAFSMLKKCSALRVVPDALPAQENQEALLASLNNIFIISNWEPEALSPGGSTSGSAVSGLGVIPVSLSIKANALKTRTVLSNIEKSIREFDITTATVKWGGSEADGTATLELQAQANAYYSMKIDAAESNKTVRYKTTQKGNKK